MRAAREDENKRSDVIGYKYRVLAVVAIVVGCLLYTHYSICKDAGSCPLASHLSQILGFSCELVLRVHSQSG